MSCPVCQRVGSRDDSTGYVDDGLCPACVREGYEEAGCGCVTARDGTLRPCGTTHRACDSGRSDDCTGMATVTLTVPYLRESLCLCEACAAYEARHVEDGPDPLRAPGIEGGIQVRR